MKAVALRHRAEHLLVVALAAVLVRTPEGLATAVARGLGFFAGAVLRIRRGVVDENLRRAFPGRSPRWYRSVALRTYRHFGGEVVSTFRLARMPPEERRARFRVEGFDRIAEPVSTGRGVLLLAGHFGNWEVAAVSMRSRGVPIDALVRRQRNPLFDGYLRETRKGLGTGVIYDREPLRAAMKSLRAGRVLALVADQNFTGDGIFVEFFGSPASTVRGPGVLAMRTGAPVVFLDPRREPGLRARYTVRYSRLPQPESDDLESGVRELTRAYTQRLEAAIRECPEQYFWFHRRWKTRPRPEQPAGTSTPG